MSRRARLVALVTLALVAAASAGCAKKKDVEDNAFAGTPAEAYARGAAELERRKLLQAIDTFQAIDFTFAVGERQTFEPLVKLGLADATFHKGTNVDLIEARSLYLDFVSNYPDHPRAPYALFQAAMCSFEQASHPSKDQSQTRTAFEDFRRVVARFPSSRYATAAAQMIRRTEALLAEHEFLVGRYYMKRKRHLAAAERFRLVLDRFPAYPEPEKIYFYLGRSQHEVDNDAEARAYFDRVLTEYPHSPWAAETRKYLASAGGFEAELKKEGG